MKSDKMTCKKTRYGVFEISAFFAGFSAFIVRHSESIENIILTELLKQGIIDANKRSNIYWEAV